MEALDSPFMRIPAEIRLLIYSFLLNDGGYKQLTLRNHPEGRLKESKGVRRTRYRVLEQSLLRRCYETTYHLTSPGAEMHTAILATSRQVYDEAAHILYGKHSFDFGPDIEAVVPFLADRTPRSRPLIGEISIYKRGPLPFLESDRYEWAHLCRFLSSTGSVRKLRLVVEGGRPSDPWDGPQELSESDLRLLTLVRHESLDWVSELAQVKGIRELEVVPDLQYYPTPRTTSMIIFAAFSASIESGLTQFLRRQLNIIS
ncbi:Autophagy-related protein 3 [Pleurostoma richardsiae]|uniref:Autophagy-related protein 3 n=1 Tax=Pleurostoma richardsiae TaxID=41990 RepID=A0AA38RSM9_9PEZI|nr:Autophagy-related protein 3 [Pleurostoma richardsiae]